MPDWISIVAAWTLLTGSLVGLAFVANARRPARTPLFVVPGFFASWLTLELAGHHLVWQALVTATLIAMGALVHPAGLIALGVIALQWVLLASFLGSGRKTHETMRKALDGVVDDEGWPRVPLSKLIRPFAPHRREVKRTRDIVYSKVAGTRLKLDVFEPRAATGAPRPAIIQIHGGAWVIGDKREQGLPLLNHLAANGWTGFNVNYRLSPAATFPDHLVDIKQAIAWVREHAEEYNIDPSFIAVTGGSAGGHLSALAALTANVADYQPGFEDADTSVQAAVPIYGVYDFTDRLRLLGRPFRQQMLEARIMKAFFDSEPEKFVAASPLDRVHSSAPPFLVIHGDRDTLAPVEYARLFVEALRSKSQAGAYYAELPGAQHAFDVFASPRTVRTVEGIERFLAHQYAIHQSNRAALGNAALDVG